LIRHAILCLVLLFCLTSPALAETQREILHQMVKLLGWEPGLPEQPVDADYLRIMNGRRSLHFEIEEVLQPGARVSMKNFRNYGAFSGDRWISGTSEPTSLQLAFRLPISGTYRVFANLRLPAFAFEIGRQIFAVDGGEKFERIEIGTVHLSAGQQTITISLPANGSIDDLELIAPALPEISPLGGWQLDQEMTAEDLSAVTLKLLDLERLLPPTGQQRLVEAEKLADLDPALRTESRYLGAPSGNAWVQAGSETTTLTSRFFLDQAGAVHLILRGLGQDPVTVRIDGEPAGTIQFPSYLQDLSGPTRFLAAGEHQIEITLPPRAGLDTLTLDFLSRDPAAYRQLAGLSDIDLRRGRFEQLLALAKVLLPER